MQQEQYMKITKMKSLIDALNNGEKFKYLFFWGHQEKSNQVTKSSLSQWYISGFQENGNTFPTAEHYMMYYKAKLFDDAKAAEKVLLSPTAKEAKQIGREVIGFNQKQWNEKRFEIVVNANFAKFSQNKALKDFLLNTGDQIIVEASPVDKIWGVGMSQDNPAISDPYSWKGLNLLGFALMEVRDRLLNQEQ